jgi:hypothetical protein
MNLTKSALFLLASFSLAATSFAGTAQLVHNPVLSAAAGQDIEIRANLVGAEGEARVRLFFRPRGKEIYRSVEMEGSASDLRASIPGSSVDLAGLEYYIEASAIVSGTKTVLATAPSNNPTLNPYPVAVRRDETGPEVTALAPMDGDTVETSHPVITAAWSDVDSGIDLSSVLIKIDGDVMKDKDNLQVFDTLMSYIPGASLADGEHEIVVAVKDKAGNAGSTKWKVTVKASASQKVEGAAKRWVWDGRTSAETQYGAVLQAPSSKASTLPYRPYGANRGRLEVTGRGADDTLSLKIFKTDEERDDQQPIDRYTATWRNRQGLVSLGDVAASFSELSLYQVPHLRGVNLDLRSGQLNEGHTRLMGVYGQTNRAVEQGSTGFSGAGSNATLAQWLYGARWEFGGRYFQMGLNSVTINDDKNSVKDPGTTQPHYNSMVTSDVRIGLPFMFLTIDGETGVDTYAADPSPLGISVGSAYKAGADLNIKPWSTRLTFDWKDLGGGFGFVPGGYSSMANPGLVPDYRGYESTFSQGLFDNQFNFNLGLNNWHDNLQGVKLATTTSDFLNIAVGIAPRQYPYLNVGYTQNLQVNDADGNTTTGNYKTDLKTASINVGLGYTKPIDEKTSASVNVNWVNTQLTDRATLRTAQDLNSDNYVLSGFISRGPSTYSASLGLGASSQPQANALGTTLAAKTGGSTSVGLRWGQFWSKGTEPAAWDSFLAWDLYQSSSASEAVGPFVKASSNNGRQTYSLGGGYKISEAQKLSASLALAMVSVDSDTGGTKFSDSLQQMLGSMRYDLSF